MTLANASIVFDLDGTLVETAPDIMRALNFVLAQAALAPATLAEVRSLVGAGSRVLIERASAARGFTHTTTALDALTLAFFAEYERDIAGASTVNPGVVEALESFVAAGARLSVCTNKATGPSNLLLDALGLSRFFQAVVGADLVAHRKPHPDHLKAAVDLSGGDPTRVLLVGDSSADVGAARGLGAKIALYAFGYTDTAPELLGSDAVFTHFADLPNLAIRLLS